MAPGAHELICPEAIKLGFQRPLVLTSGLRGTDIVHIATETVRTDRVRAPGMPPKNFSNDTRSVINLATFCDEALTERFAERHGP